jgi:hypothetical protein
MNTTTPVVRLVRVARPTFRARRGVAAVLAMLYLMLFSTLAIGTYAAFNLNAQIAHTEKDLQDARLAAESGMAFMRHLLWSLSISHRTPPDQLFQQVYQAINADLANTRNLGANTIGYDGTMISIPAAAGATIKIDADNNRFRATIEKYGKELIVRVTGYAGGADVSRGVEMHYGIFERPSSIFDYGVASRSTINMIGNTRILGSPNPAAGNVLSTASVAYPLSMGSSTEISGEVSFSNPTAWVSAGTGAKIAGKVGEANWRNNVHFVDEPDFPVIDTDDYVPFATTNFTSKNPGPGTYKNIRIKAGTNPTFNGNVTLEGVIYIETPNQVKFNGNASLTGIIVTQNNPTGDWTTNVLNFAGTFNARGVKDLPSTPTYDQLRTLGGAMILADKFFVRFGGTAGSGSTSVAGAVVASKMEFYGTADARVDGSVINLDNTAVDFKGNAAVTIVSSGTSDQPHGLFFGSRYEPLPGSYAEFIP